MFNHVKYDTPDHKGKTRRERNQLAGWEDNTPEIDFPHEALYLWGWFFEISNTRHDCEKRLQFSEIDAWSRLSGNDLTPYEFELITAMDAKFVEAFRAEMADNRKRQEDQQKAIADSRGRR